MRWVLCLVFWIAALAALQGEDSVEEPKGKIAKLYDYEGYLDTGARARTANCKQWVHITEGEFRALQAKYDAKAFDGWVKKLEAIREGMTLEEIKTILKPRKVIPMVTFGSGTATFLELDEVYFVQGLFFQDGTMNGVITKPVAITYAVRHRNFLAGERANPMPGAEK